MSAGFSVSVSAKRSSLNNEDPERISVGNRFNLRRKWPSEDVRCTNQTHTRCAPQSQQHSDTLQEHGCTTHSRTSFTQDPFTEECVASVIFYNSISLPIIFDTAHSRIHVAVTQVNPWIELGRSVPLRISFNLQRSTE